MKKGPLLRRALRLEQDDDARCELWTVVARASALKFDGEAFWTAMQNSLKVCSNKATCADTYSELAFQTAIRSSMWAKRPARELVAGWIEQALELWPRVPDAAQRCGMDVVEVSPPYDVAEITALAAATFAWEYLGLLAPRANR